jgi:hypothetical protein
VNEGGRLRRVPGALPAEIPDGAPWKVVVHERQQGIQRVASTGAKIVQQAYDRSPVCGWHRSCRTEGSSLSHLSYDPGTNHRA